MQIGNWFKSTSRYKDLLTTNRDERDSGTVAAASLNVASLTRSLPAPGPPCLASTTPSGAAPCTTPASLLRASTHPAAHPQVLLLLGQQLYYALHKVMSLCIM